MRIEQIDNLQRPLTMEDGGVVLMDLLWSDPTTNDGVEGVQPSPRGPGLVTFGPDRVKEFCKVDIPPPDDMCWQVLPHHAVMLAARDEDVGSLLHGMSRAPCWYLHINLGITAGGPHAICGNASQYATPPLPPPFFLQTLTRQKLVKLLVQLPTTCITAVLTLADRPSLIIDDTNSVLLSQTTSDIAGLLQSCRRGRGFDGLG